MSPPPVRALENAIFVPSGDQAGPWSLPAVFVSWSRPVPSGSIVHTSKPVPPELLVSVYAIRPLSPGNVDSAGEAAKPANTSASARVNQKRRDSSDELIGLL